MCIYNDVYVGNYIDNYIIIYVYSSGHTLRTPFGKRMVETSAAECVLSIHLEHLKKTYT